MEQVPCQQGGKSMVNPPRKKSFLCGWVTRIFLPLTGGARSRAAEAAFAIYSQVFLLCQGWPDQPACPFPSGKILRIYVAKCFMPCSNVAAGSAACVKSGGRGTPVKRGCKQADGDAPGNYQILN